LALIEFLVRRKLTQNQEKLTGLIGNNPKKTIDSPTTERLLKTFFREINLTIMHWLMYEKCEIYVAARSRTLATKQSPLLTKRLLHSLENARSQRHAHI
jgi:hypothetical protein